MKKSGNWYSYRYQWSVNYFLDHGIPMLWGSETATANQDMDAATASDDEIEPPAELVKRRIIQDPVPNAESVPSARRFSPGLFAFSFVADTYSSLGYRFVRDVLLILAEETLRRKDQQSLLYIQENRADRAKIQKVMADYITQCDPFPEVL